ncbi:MauE/DoxX family redox-associated membrane protein [Streptomyces echinatus]|uniref:MauE/DoxX family redox-associated membrane protein n=1 Tax=Streptomyces echinatus TaxID=67293 RepID=UPI0037B14DD5
MTSLIDFGRIFLFSTFVVFAVSKLAKPAGFRDHIAATLPVSLSAARALAAGTLALEFAAAGLVMFDATLTAGSGLAAGLLAAFTAYIVFLLVKDPEAGCGCAGRSERVSALDLARNVVLLAVSCLTLLVSASGADVPPVTDDPAWFLLAGASAVAVAHAGQIRHVVALFTAPVK